jgi:hypothetical protein
MLTALQREGNGVKWWVIFAGLVSLFVVVVVTCSAWVSEDCFITFRYVDNTIHGYGAVFNVGEYVQGLRRRHCERRWPPGPERLR